MSNGRVRGTIRSLNIERGYGFIRVPGQVDHFLHCKALQDTSQFDDLKPGMTVEFDSVDSEKKPGSKDAKSVSVVTSPGTNHFSSPALSSSPQNRKHEEEQPYNFIPIDIENAVLEDVTFHHGAYPNEDRRSGVLKVTWTTLTPTLVGHDQVAANNIADGHRAPVGTFTCPWPEESENEEKRKKALLPLRATWMNNEPVIWPGSGLKGMLKQSIGSLLAAPMERVDERHFTYRPNLDQAAAGGRGRLIRKFGVVTTLTSTTMKVKLVDPDAIWFVQNDQVENNLRAASYTNVGEDHNRGRKKLVLQSGGNWSPPTGGITIAKYHHGADGRAQYASAFKSAQRNISIAIKPHPALAIDTSALKTANDIPVPQGVVNQWRETMQIMADDKVGHRKDHPLDGEPHFPLKEKSFAELARGDAVVAEVDKSGEIVTLGHYFNYRTAYADSVRQRLVFEGSKFVMEDRPEVKKLAGEIVNEMGGKLSGARVIFGYTHLDKGVHGKLEIGIKDFSRLSGRIGCNHALEVIGEGESDRFLNPGSNYWVALKELGSPKPSAVETYLDQTDLTEAEPRAGTLLTYGDSYRIDDSGNLEVENRAARLRGRKVYPHQAAINLRDFHDEATIDNVRALLARHVSDKGIKFKSAIHHQDLKPWEFGALLAALEPGEFAKWMVDNVFPSNPGYFRKLKKQLANARTDQFAHKLGHGRPLGLGSVRADVHGLEAGTRNTAFAKLWDVIDAAAADSKERLDCRLAAWFRARKFTGTQTLAYQKGQDEKIFSHHTTLRKNHAVARRKNIQAVDITDSALKPLEDIS